MTELITQIKDKAILGCILGTAVGDSMGLPYEGMTTERVAKFFRLPLQQGLVFGHGMISDDTEHTCLVAKALILANGDVDKFERKLAWGLRGWFLGLPAGIGLATGRAIIKLCLGFPPKYSGVFSAGNGPAMRSALIGVVYAEDLAKLATFVYRSTRLTHTDPKAYLGAATVALAARAASSTTTAIDPQTFVKTVTEILATEMSSEYQQQLQKVSTSIARGENLAEFTAAIGCQHGVSGYIYHTVPAVIHCWLRHQHDYAAGLSEIIAAGGDTDTTGAIYGAIAGAQVGKAGIPLAWLEKLNDYPRSTTYMQRLGQSLAQALSRQQIQKPPRLFWLAIVPRNFVFLVIVLLHGLRRLLPPY